MELNVSFNKTGFSKFLNNTNGRIFRISAGIFFIITGYIYRSSTLGVISMLWGLLPLSAGLFDVCYISALLGGPFSGTEIRRIYK